MQIDDTIRLEYLLKLLNLGGTNGFMKIAPEVCGDWNRALIDSALREDIKSIKADLQKSLKDLGEKKYEIERAMEKYKKEIEELE